MMDNKSPYQLEIGDFFSYPGSFKIYKVQTKPKIDPDFTEPQRCGSCNQDYLPCYRMIFEVTDGGLRDHMGIRLRSDVVCTIHKEFELPPLAKQLEEIGERGHLEKIGDGWRFFFDEDFVPAHLQTPELLDEPTEGTLEEAIADAYTKYQRNAKANR